MSFHLMLSVMNKEEILRWIRAYYDLCSEEYHLNKKIWKLWDAGMKDSLKKPAFIDAPR